MNTRSNDRPSFATLARGYLSSLNTYRDAKSAVAVAWRIGQDTRELEHHAARMHAVHQESLGALVDLAVQLREVSTSRQAAA